MTDGRLVLDARETLRGRADGALVAFGQGFVSHDDNTALRKALTSGALSSDAFFKELLRLVFRVIFLLVAEERGILHDRSASSAVRHLYSQKYGVRRLRDLAVSPSDDDSRGGLWAALTTTFRALIRGDAHLGLPGLGGIFDDAHCPNLDAACLPDAGLLLGILRLSWVKEGEHLKAVSWRDLAPEELGSLYESLLDLTPAVSENRFTVSRENEAKASARRVSGSYYTPDGLVQTLLDRALEPLVADVISRHADAPTEALLGLAIVDPACGSGHILLAAAHRLAHHVAVSKADGSPSKEQHADALGRVIERCLYGVDLDPMAVLLCKLSLWMAAAVPDAPLTFIDAHIQHGNSLLGATPALLEAGIPDTAWAAGEGDDRKVARALRRQNRRVAEHLELDVSPGPPQADDSTNERTHQRFVADVWCAAFLWPKAPGTSLESAPTDGMWRDVRAGRERAPVETQTTVRGLVERFHVFHWHLQFPDVFARGGFDLVLGNPPWIAHAGRAAQPLPSSVRRFFEHAYESFADYPTTHGMFVSLAAQVLRRRGRLGLVIPSSVSDLRGYAATRLAHDRLCTFGPDLVDFGEGRFPGVTQPCMALVSQRVRGGRGDAAFGSRWPVERPDLSPVDRGLLARLATLPVVPREIFGERGVQSDKLVTEHFSASSVPKGRFTVPIREGTDVREFALLPPRYHVDPVALGKRLRPSVEFGAVRVLIRQTARYPIAAVSDGLPFRNSVLAALHHPEWPPHALAALLNSALIRWAHFMRFRDARQPIMPQVKIGHLRDIRIPVAGLGDSVAELDGLGRRITACSEGDSPAVRAELDRLTAILYGLSNEEVAAVTRWHDERGPRSTHREGRPRLRSSTKQ